MVDDLAYCGYDGCYLKIVQTPLGWGHIDQYKENWDNHTPVVPEGEQNEVD